MEKRIIQKEKEEEGRGRRTEMVATYQWQRSLFPLNNGYNKKTKVKKIE